MKEVELGELVIDWLKTQKPGWEVFQEIRHSKYAGSPIADIVCVKEKSVWVIELKKRLNLDVIRQAENWKVDFRSIAVMLPKTTSGKDNARWWFTKIRYHMGIGTILIDPARYGPRVIEHKEPKLYDQNPYHQEGFLEICNSGLTKGMAKAGGKDGGYWTPYKETMKSVRSYIEKHPGCGVGDIVGALGKMHYSSEHSAKTNLVKNLPEIEGDWCRSETRGTYKIFFVREGK